ncbi:SpoIIE family protein phosphatase [Streptomyces fulvoviolaceus]|uniref:SpoIIE family protein phosphatase n=1 Tax=Streptomyces fulvoviolaceus TaxID=285535 RepID=UPI0004CB6935|nr:SpoIIE family protein phosphatase [Streptomyces fulvoviolaceus]MCT9079764.1 SpoIIE family protein phosphatase [Streptomyces fulvoviolaceus]
MAELAKVVARQRAEMDRLRDQAATSAVLERAKGALMALTGCTPVAAGEELLQRAKAANRTLLEECWMTLGGLVPPLHPTTPEPRLSDDLPGGSVSALPGPGGAGLRDFGADHPSPGIPATRGTDDTDEGFTALGRLGKALVRVATPQDLAHCLLEHLGPDVGAEAVMLFQRLPAGGLELVGHAGIDDTLAAQWQRVPPLTGVGALDALRAREPRWLEDIARDRERYLLIGDPPERWLSRAWLPVPAADKADVCVGILRAQAGPFTPRTRHLLRAVARLCAGWFQAFGTRQEIVVGAATDAAQAVFDSLPGAAMLLTPLRTTAGEVEDYRIDAATAEAVDIVGRTGRELVGRRILECFPSMAEDALWRGCLRTLTTGEPFEGDPFAYQEIVAGAAELSTYSVRSARLGGGLVVTWVRHASSDRQEQRLADVQRLGNLGWANWNLVTHEASWSSQAFSVLDRDPEDGAVGLFDLPHLALPEDVPALSRVVRELVRAGRPFDIPFRIPVAGGVRHLRVVAEAVADTDGTPVEVHGFVQDLTAQRSAELALVESEQAMLTQHDVLRAERTLASRLQHALLPLPTRPVQLAGLRVDVAYLPAQSGIHVGGDWFSAIELPDGDALFVVGDVAGHGIDAVATMAQLRFTAKGMVITGSSLTGALTRLNTLLLHSRDSHGTATMVLARYNSAARRLVWAQAGHPPPLLVRGGKVRYLDRPGGMLLGASASPPFEEAECRLEPGDRLMLYTDGLVERPTEGLDLGLARLAEAVAAHHADEPGALVPLLATVLAGDRRDDVCVLDIRVPSGAE